MDWQVERNKKLCVGEQQWPHDLLEHPEPTKLNDSLSRFVTEVRKKDGSPYSPRSIHLILAALQRKMVETTLDAPKFFDPKNYCYRDLQRNCNYTYKQLRSEGIGAHV